MQRRPGQPVLGQKPGPEGQRPGQNASAGIDHLDGELASGRGALQCPGLAQYGGGRDRELGHVLGPLAQGRVQRSPKLITDHDHRDDREQGYGGQDRRRSRRREARAQRSERPQGGHEP